MFGSNNRKGSQRYSHLPTHDYNGNGNYNSDSDSEEDDFITRQIKNQQVCCLFGSS